MSIGLLHIQMQKLYRSVGGQIQGQIGGNGGLAGTALPLATTTIFFSLPITRLSAVANNGLPVMLAVMVPMMFAYSTGTKQSPGQVSINHIFNPPVAPVTTLTHSSPADL